MSVGFEKAYLMQTSLNLTTSEVISTYTYKVGLMQAEYSYSTAIGLFNNVINFTLLIVVNWVARRASGSSLWEGGIEDEKTEGKNRPYTYK